MLSESDTRAKLIDPAIHARGWTEDLIRREETAGSIEIYDGRPRRQGKGRVDYTLRYKVHTDTQPIALALIEAKKESLPPGHGLEQAKLYSACNRLNVKFVFSSNGHLFVEYDHFTGLTSSPRPLSEFPSPEELRARYEKGIGFSLTDEAAKPLLARYQGGEATRRYYQDAAIRAVLEKLARCEKTGKPKRALLSLATGAGKTFIAVNLLRRIADAGQLKRALFVCDRDELRAQGAGAFQNVFGSDAATVSSDNPQKNARILVATYQTLNVDSDEADANFLTTHYPEDYFSHIVIDECHRSAWGKWSQVMTRNPNAVQVGLTATPRKIQFTEKTKESLEDEQVTADNIRHFGEPVYEYTMSQGIEDGYLAACEIIKGRVNLDNTGITLEDIMKHNPRNAITGKHLVREEVEAFYEKTDYESRVLLPDRVFAMCQDLFKYMLETGGPQQKTIIFCVRDRHAEDVKDTLNNLYATWCKDNGKQRLDPYAFKCTASVGGGLMVGDLRGASRSHFIATTVDLLTTGVDVPAVVNIVFFKYVRSPISFYQMVGRGTRIDFASGKLMFRVYDYTDATRLFGEEFITKQKKSGGGGDGPAGEPEPSIIVEGITVEVTPAGRFIVAEVDGVTKPITVEEYKERLAARLVEEAPTLEKFRDRWINPSERRELVDKLVKAGNPPKVLIYLEDMQDFDLYDVLAEVGYGMAPRTKRERADAFGYKHGAWLAGLPSGASRTLTALAEQFAHAGTEGLESPKVFETKQVQQAGGLAALKALGSPKEVLQETKKRIFAA